MSDTHKTKPLHVKQKQGHAPYEIVHDHSKGPCDLIPAEEEFKERKWHNRSCYRNWVYEGKNNICGCARCTAQSGRKNANRRKRKHVKQKLGKVLHDLDLYDEEVIDEYHADKWYWEY